MAYHSFLDRGEAVSLQQKVAAARRYCELIGAPIDRHQVVVYEHRDKKHAHVHIYLNRVPIDGGPALRTDNNFYRQPAITRQISQELGMQPLPERRRSIKDLDPKKEAAREQVGQALKHLFSLPDRRGGVAGGPAAEPADKRALHPRPRWHLAGVSFEWSGIRVKGQEAGYKAGQLREEFARARTEQAKQQSPLKPVTGLISKLPVPANQEPPKRNVKLKPGK
ncbi:relaxase/mobilization nuclease domain-containing protein [Hymenobacter humi]|uniref:Relaxase/mobilization nuclease domain-containing protein n=1 Tax=Hymenobacter humi TaxID=1411620 RepID=A0ABW2UB15_9BACT